MNDEEGPKSAAQVLPRGTVTFLFSDIEGSTRLIRRVGDNYSRLLADQRQLIRTCVGKWRGKEVDTQGDSFFSSFAKATDAIQAAVEIQRAMTEHPWPKGARVRLRMGLHSGEPALAEEGYVGLDVTRAARIGNLGHGGQVLLSETTAALVRRQLPDGVRLRDLGRHRLKDFQQLEPVSQLLISGMPTRFPALHSLGACPNNLPYENTPFVGRTEDLESLGGLLSEPVVRLVTILGAGGMGKTRLALAAAEEQILASKPTGGEQEPWFLDGVFFVPLVSLNSSDLLVSTIADAVCFQFYQGVEQEQQLLDFFQKKETLLVLDNFEHLLEGAALLSRILRAAPRVKVLVTSREKLNILAEVVYPLKGMTYPKQGIEVDRDLALAAQEFSAVRLFLQNATRLNPELGRTQGELRSIVDICRLVEGMPLGIELAAAWTQVLSLPEIEAEIRHGLDFLVSERRDAPERHHSLRAVFDSTWKMMDDDACDVFQRLSVFRGGFTRQAAEQVAGATPKILRALANKSLIRLSQDGRYRIHALLRHYAHEKLSHDPMGVNLARDRHCEYFSDFIHRHDAAIRAADLGELMPEMDNIRSGFRWAVTRDKDPEIRQQILGLWRLYENNGWRQEAEIIFTWAADLFGGEAPTGERGIAYGLVLSVLGWFIRFNGRAMEGTELWRKGQAILRRLEAPEELAWVSATLARFGEGVGYGEATGLFQECLAIYEELGFDWGTAFTHFCWGDKAIFERRYPEAECHYRAAIETSVGFINHNDMAWYLSGLGHIALRQGNYPRAKELLEDAYWAFRATDNKQWAANRLMDLGDLAIQMGDFEEAQARHQQALSDRESMGNQAGVAMSIGDLGYAAMSMGEYDLAKDRFEAALTTYKRLGNTNGEAFMLLWLGDLAVKLSDLKEAEVKHHEALKLGAVLHKPDLCLDILAGSAGRYELAGDVVRAAELMALVEAHPETYIYTRENVRQSLEKLAPMLEPEALQQAKEYGKGLDLWGTVNTLLAESGGPGQPGGLSPHPRLS
jgi:predicted ATPase/class 3 adenylate cyclase